MGSLRQVLAITWMNLRSVPQRPGASLVVIVGIAGVVAVLVSVLSMAQGFRHTLASTGRPDRAILLRSGSDAELASSIARDQAQILANTPEIARDSQGQPLASAELVVVADLPRRDTGTPSNVPFRGVQPAAFAIRDELRLVQGRRFGAGLREVIVGQKAAQQFQGLEVGARIDFRDSDWEVVGIFASGGDVHESEVWADAETAVSAFRRLGFQSMTAKLAITDDLDALRQRIDADPRFSISVLREPEYYAKQSQLLGTLINVLGYTVASFMAIGAMFGALNCMYSAVASRQVEIGTLRAIGFGAAPVVVSVMAEALLLALIGGTAGGALAYLYCDGASLSTLNFETFSQVAFDFRITPALLGQGVLWALAIGLLGGLPPAIRAARLPVTEALRSS
ncbi:ABC transporter permease [Methyloterricola oryzae]|uniref:ABC transporter permease n=1 Tax=Methyloterricola oryzae TaxID=1495050 RepID=UPI0005EACFFD|nr:ABC transporter permease [Methyloterricola oryzae]